MESTNFCWNKGGIYGLLCKKVDILLNYLVSIYLKFIYLVSVYLHTSATAKTSKNVVCKDFRVKIFSSWLIWKSVFIEILHNSLTIVNNSEDVVKGGCLEKPLLWNVPIFFKINGKHKVSSVK